MAGKRRGTLDVCGAQEADQLVQVVVVDIGGAAPVAVPTDDDSADDGEVDGQPGIRCQAPNRAQQNPITCFDSLLGNRECSCGYGKPISRGDFLPSHDQRTIHERIARIGTVKDSIAWFDQTWKHDEAQQGEAA